MEQKIIVKKLLANAGTSTAIKENIAGEPGNVVIPYGWTVKQISTSTIDKGGETRFIVLTMLLEKV